jgi:hypothetical protein
MRRFVPAVLVAAIACACLAIPASASFDHHFSVVAKHDRFHQDSDGIRFQSDLFATWNHHNQVGHNRGKCRDAGDGFRCKVKFHFNGEVGGRGDIRAHGDGSGDHRLVVVGGSGDFNGVAGKALVHWNRHPIKLDIDLNR